MTRSSGIPGQELSDGSVSNLRYGFRQNVIFAPSCTRRGGAAFTTCPNVWLSRSPSTATGPKN